MDYETNPEMNHPWSESTKALFFSAIAAIVIVGGLALWANWDNLTVEGSTTEQEQVLPEDAEHLAAVQYLIGLAEDTGIDPEALLNDEDIMAYAVRLIAIKQQMACIRRNNSADALWEEWYGEGKIEDDPCSLQDTP